MCSKVEEWIEKEIEKAEAEIEDNGPFLSLQERIDTLQEVLEKIQEEST